jgi:hypothetical protein
LTTWDKELQANVQLLVEDEELEDLLRSQSKLVHCSDGGVTDGLGSFGWVLVDEETGRILARGQGPAHGDSEMMHSFRAEGYGGIAATHFMKHAMDYFKIPKDERALEWTWTCDNLGLIKRLKRLQQKLPITGCNLKTDADVCQELAQTLNALPKRKIRHVKGHQDREGAPLSLDAQLNVEADAQATEYFQTEISTSPTKPKRAFLEAVPKMPHCGAQLVNRHNPKAQRFITTRVRDELREAALTPDLRAYMIDKYDGWTQGTPKTVDWLAYTKGSKKSIMDPVLKSHQAVKRLGGDSSTPEQARRARSQTLPLVQRR